MVRVQTAMLLSIVFFSSDSQGHMVLHFLISVITVNRKWVKGLRNEKGSIKSAKLRNVVCQHENTPVLLRISIKLFLVNSRVQENKSMQINGII